MPQLPRRQASDGSSPGAPDRVRPRWPVRRQGLAWRRCEALAIDRLMHEWAYVRQDIHRLERIWDPNGRHGTALDATEFGAAKGATRMVIVSIGRD